MTCTAHSPLLDLETANRVRAAISQLKSLPEGTITVYKILMFCVREREREKERENHAEDGKRKGEKGMIGNEDSRRGREKITFYKSGRLREAAKQDTVLLYSIKSKVL